MSLSRLSMCCHGNAPVSPSVERREEMHVKIGYLGYIGLSFLLVLTFLAMHRIGQSLADNPPKEGKKLNPWLYSGFMSVIILPIAGMIMVHGTREYHRLLTIQQHGRRTEASVDLIYRHCSGRSPCSLRVQYHYQPLAQGRTTQLIGDARLGRDRPDDPHVAYARTTGHVPIGYDLRNPYDSALNFDDSVFTKDQARQVLVASEVDSTMILGGLGLMALSGLLVLVYQRSKTA